MWSQLWSSYIGCRLSKELHTSCVCSLHHIHTEQAPQYLSDFPQFLHSVADTSWGRLAQLITFCQEQELDLENEVSPTVAQPPGTFFLRTSTTLLTFRKRLKSVLFDRAYHWLLLALLDVSYSGALQISRWLIDWLVTINISDCRQFSDIHISQGSVARYLTCDGTFTYQFVANLSQPVSERIWKLVNIWGSYGKQFSVFFDTLCTCYSNVLDELYNLNSDIWDIHVITSALKLFFRELPEPVISYELCDQFLRANGK